MEMETTDTSKKEEQMRKGYDKTQSEMRGQGKLLVKALLRQINEVVCGDWHGISVQLHRETSHGSVDRCDLKRFKKKRRYQHMFVGCKNSPRKTRECYSFLTFQ